MHIQRVKFKDIEQVPYMQVQQEFKKDFQGSAPAPFIGRFGYPQVNIGILSPQIPGDTSHYDAPKLWSLQNIPIGNIASLRYGLVNSRTQWNVKDVLKPSLLNEASLKQSHLNQSSLKQSRFLEVCQEVGMASKPVEVEVNLKDRPMMNIKSEKEIIPFGPQAQMQRAQITANPFVDSRVERVVGDTDLKAGEAIVSLYQKGFEENFLTKLISVGNTGLGKNRKLVPTRWSITAVDDTLGKNLIGEVKDFPVGEYQAYFGGGWGNYYLILLFPWVWSYELFESYLEYKVNPWSKEGNFYSTDYEGYEGRKGYAEETAGAYYSTRLATLETMKLNKKQSSALVLRFITSEYNIPLGVWVTREACRRALQNKPIEFSSQELMLNYAKSVIKSKFGFDLYFLLEKSRLINSFKQQSKLTKFL